jgi:xanthosine utilization system XapX-like protein
MFPIKGEFALILAVIFGFAFGWLLQRGKVTSYNVIVNQFRFRDFTVLKVMMTAIIVGGVLFRSGTGSVHALVGMVGMLIGAVLYAFSFSWVKANILSVWALGKVTLPQLWGVSPWVLYSALTVGAGLLFYWVEKQKK